MPPLLAAGSGLFPLLIVVVSIIVGKIIEEAKKNTPKRGANSPPNRPPSMSQQQLEERLRDIVAKKRGEAEVKARERAVPAPPPPQKAPLRSQSLARAGVDRVESEARTIASSAEMIAAKAEKLTSRNYAVPTEVTAPPRRKLRTVSDAQLRPADAIQQRLRKSPAALREAFVLSEILGKPKGLRDDF